MRHFTISPFRIAMLALAMPSMSFADDIRATVDGRLVSFPDAQPVMMNQRVMVPIRGVFEHMGASVKWNGADQSVTAVRGEDVVTCRINSLEATLNGNPVTMDQAVVSYRGRTMVPLRFLSASLGASVAWYETTRTVEINTAKEGAFNMATLPIGTVIPFKLNSKLTSNGSQNGDKFQATIDTGAFSNYEGIAQGAVVNGSVEDIRAMTKTTPGILGLNFNQVQMPDGRKYAVQGTLIGLDEKSVSNENGRLVAKGQKSEKVLQYVGIGAGVGTLVGILTKGNVLTDAAIGGALGFLFGSTQKSDKTMRDVVLEKGTTFGIRLDESFSFRTKFDLFAANSFVGGQNKELN